MPRNKIGDRLMIQNEKRDANGEGHTAFDSEHMMRSQRLGFES